MAVHRDRSRLELHLGRAAPLRAQPPLAALPALLHGLTHQLAQAGWKLQTVSTDNGSEFAAQEFRQVVEAAGARQRRIKAGRPTSNGCIERAQLTILEEC